MNTRTRTFGFSASLLSICALIACGPTASSPTGIELRFAQLEQAEIADPGLPADLGSLRVDVLAMGALGEDPVATTGCLAPGAGDAARQSISFDLRPADNLAVQVLGWSGGACGAAEAADWKGLTFSVALTKGEETTIPIYVTRTGFRINPIRDTLPAGRAFASATWLPGGKVLIAGGFDRLSGDTVPVTLSAACDALLYDPGTARIERVIPLPNGCRGLHQAISRPDGRVLLIGGATEATFDPSGATRPMLRPVATSLLSSIEVFDPSGGDSKEGAFLADPSSDPSLRRALASAVPLADGTLLVLGGRTGQLRSADLILGNAAGGVDFAWSLLDETLVAGRSGAASLALSQGVLISGGNAPGTPSLELLLPDDRISSALDPGAVASDRLALCGHGLVATGGSTFVLTGGASNQPGGLPSAAAFRGIWSGDTYGLTESRLARERAYHASLMMRGVAVAGTIRTVHIGGLNASLRSNADLEIVDPGQDGLLLDDALGTGAIGVAAVVMADGTALIAGGLDLGAGGQISASAEARILAP